MSPRKKKELLIMASQVSGNRLKDSP